MNGNKASEQPIRPVVLTIAGSDSGGGAGIAADLRVFHRLGTFGTSAITAVTAQNLGGVTDVAGIESPLVRAQIDAVVDGFPVGAAKTGMLWTRSTVEMVADAAAARAFPIVVDPVMVATSGARLVDEAAIDAYCEHLLPRAALATPNLDEAAVLLGDESIDRAHLRGAADRLFERFGCPILLKGGHVEGHPIDVLRHADDTLMWTHQRVTGVNTHGSGCMLSAAIAAYLATGESLERACERGLAFVHDALLRSIGLSSTIRLAGIEQASDTEPALTRL
ncbi:MAG: bifunctional hydroxymethylpyrimidine kinase/phosphomethylpyrimidine kinase [Proteobacteria bacterium]|nr:bifunctional hydroxymethylpyrimidine kinase/phosphomethylpyrimidine kinase [Pseudomonadota bacterium]